MGAERAEVRSAIVDAFQQSELDRLLRDHFDYDMAKELDLSGGFVDIVDRVLDAFERDGRYPELLARIARERPKKREIQSAVGTHAVDPEPRRHKLSPAVIGVVVGAIVVAVGAMITLVVVLRNIGADPPPATYPDTAPPACAIEVTIDSTPRDAKISLGNDVIGVTPMKRRKLACSSGTLVVELASYQARKVTLGTRNIDEMFKLELRGWATLESGGRAELHGETSFALADARRLVKAECRPTEEPAGGVDFVGPPRSVANRIVADYHCRFREDDLVGMWRDPSGQYTATFDRAKNMVSKMPSATCASRYAIGYTSAGAKLEGGGSPLPGQCAPWRWTITWEARPTPEGRWVARETPSNRTFRR